MVSEQFTPETGAYGGGHKHGHDETFAEDYAAAQRVFHEHGGEK
jgi:urease accessory protein